MLAIVELFAASNLIEHHSNYRLEYNDNLIYKLYQQSPNAIQGKLAELRRCTAEICPLSILVIDAAGRKAYPRLSNFAQAITVWIISRSSSYLFAQTISLQFPLNASFPSTFPLVYIYVTEQNRTSRRLLLLGQWLSN